MKSYAFLALAGFLLLSHAVIRGQGADPDLPPASGMPLPLVVKQKGVQKELGVGREQIAQAKRIYGQMRDKQITGVEAHRKLFQLLTKEQSARLREISWQIRDGSALTDPELAGPLRLTNEQVKTITHLWSQEAKSLQDALARTRFKSDADRQAFVNTHLQKANKRLKKFLSPKQLKTFAALKGKDFSQLPPGN